MMTGGNYKQYQLIRNSITGIRRLSSMTKKEMKSSTFPSTKLQLMTEKDHNCRDDNRTSADIEKYGLSVIIIEATEYLPSFAYSIGLWQKFSHPEIICFGLTTKTLGTNK
jgi:hypothetical protein